MWPSNPLTERLKLKWPILQTPMEAYTTPFPAAAVSNAGGPGGLGMIGCSAEEPERKIAGFRQRSDGSLNVSYLLSPAPSATTDEIERTRRSMQPHCYAKGLVPVAIPRAAAGEVSPEHLAMLLSLKPAMVSFHFGLPPANVVRAIRVAGIFVSSSASTVAKAPRLEAPGVDAIVAQDTEAGGHRGTFTNVAPYPSWHLGSALRPGGIGWKQTQAHESGTRANDRCCR